MSEEEKSPAELEGQAAERMEELVEEQVEETAADLAGQLDLPTNPDEDEALKRRVDNGTVTEADIIAKARTELYKKMGGPELGVRDLATIYITGLRVEEARLKVKMKHRDDDAAGGVKDLRQKARRAMAAHGQGGDDDD